MVLRDNYFGSFTHFSTLNEYLEKRRRHLPVGDPVDMQYRPGQSNSLQVEIQVEVTHGLVVLPVGLPGYEPINTTRATSAELALGACLVLSIPRLGTQLRTHEEFMGERVNTVHKSCMCLSHTEMCLDSNVINGCIEAEMPEKVLFGSPMYTSLRESLLFDGWSAANASESYSD
jgi:hypothetical protein